jgi:hypothetical protein
MKFKEIKYNKLISNKKIFEDSLKKTKEFYRPLDPGQFLYNLLLEKRRKIDIFSDEYLELVYTTLIAWNMNGRGAKLSEIDKFKKTIRENKKIIKSLEKYKLINLKEKELVLEKLKILFFNLDLTETKSKIVTFSKTLHFILPELIVPIDRKYTLDFFYNNKQIPTDKNKKKNCEKQFKIFEELFEKFIEISKVYNLNKYLDKIWHVTPTKVIDNAIIGYNK